MFMDARRYLFHKGIRLATDDSNINYKLVFGSWRANARN